MINPDVIEGYEHELTQALRLYSGVDDKELIEMAAVWADKFVKGKDPDYLGRAIALLDILHLIETKSDLS